MGDLPKKHLETDSTCLPNVFPDELLIEIFVHLSIVDRIRLRSVCRRLHRLTLVGIRELFFSLNFLNAPAIHETFPVAHDQRIFFEAQKVGLLNKVMIFLFQEIGTHLTRLWMPRSWHSHLGHQITWNGPHPINASRFKKLGIFECRKLFQLLAIKCPNLVEIDCGHEQNFPPPAFQTFIETFGQQLQVCRFCFDYYSISKYIDQLNPEKLRVLSFVAKTSLSIEKVCRRFPLLEEIHMFYDRPKEFNLKPLALLPRLRQFRCTSFEGNDLTFSIPPKTQMAVYIDFLVYYIQTEHDELDLKNCPASETAHLQRIGFYMQEAEQLENNLSNCPNLKELVLDMYVNLSNGLHSIAHLRQLKYLACYQPNADYERLQLDRMPCMASVNFLQLKFRISHENCKTCFDSIGRVFPNLIELKLSFEVTEFDALVSLIDALAQLRLVHLEIEDKYSQVLEQLLRPHCRSKNVHLVVYQFIKTTLKRRRR